jgi:outer membrane lipoprotein-sorting protein|tara:strand:+ start:4026 stop:4628 length:603 start_codon:yes stop_codon:yes gene_type:complete
LGRKTLLTVFIIALFGAPVRAEKISLSNLSSYLESIKKVSGNFTQINSDKTVSTGRIFLFRPGRMRMEYKTPDNSLVIVGGSQIAVFDSKSNTHPRVFPLRKTPLKILLEKKINLKTSDIIIRHEEVENSTVVVLQDPKLSSYGSLKLVFTDHPVTLRQWVITNEMSDQTVLKFKDFINQPNMSSNKFDISLEIDNREVD